MQKNILIAFGLLVVVCTHAAPRLTAGDRHPAINCVFPEDVFLHAGKGGLVIDVTKPPFSAKGDGITDDTVAIVRAYDYCLELLDKTRWSLPKGQDNHISPYIYFPNGTYLISDTIVYSGPVRAGWNLIPRETQEILGRKETSVWDGDEGDINFHLFNMAREYHPMKGMNMNEHVARIRLVGQSRDQTVIRLKDRAPGFGLTEGLPSLKPVISFGKSHMNNHLSRNQLKNLTLETGKGNPGAIGVEWVGANNCEINNVTIRSLDGQGAMGIRFRIVPVQNYHYDITIEGFDYGMYLCGYHVTHPALEYITLKDQNKAGVLIQNSSASLRSVLSENRVPALITDAVAAHAILIDSQLNGSGTSSPAVDARKGHVFVRNVRTDGYASAVKSAGRVLRKGPYVKELVNGTILTPKGEDRKARSLNLPIEEVPLPGMQDNLSDWANVMDYGATGDGETDDSSAVQAAMDSGKGTIYFPWGSFLCETPIVVPVSVKRINGMNHDVKMTAVVKDMAAEPLWIYEIRDVRVQSECDRTLVLQGVKLAVAEQAAPKVFISCGCMMKELGRATVWARGVNTEGAQLPLTASANSKLWIFGFKTERGLTGAKHLITQVKKGFKGAPCFYVEKGGQLEVLGGVAGVHNRGFLINEGGQVSMVCATGAKPALLKQNMHEAIVDHVGRKRVVLIRDDLPERSPASDKKLGWNIIVPLYVSNP